MTYHIVGVGKKLDAPWYQCNRPFTTKGAQNQHALILGGSGSGKTNALAFLAGQDAELHRGHIIIDTHGVLVENHAEKLLENTWRPEDLVFINPTDQRWGSPGINLLEVLPEQHPFEVIAETTDAFHSLFSESTGYRMQDLLRKTFLALQEAQLTLTEAELFLTSADFRARVVATLANQDVKGFWTNFENLKPTDQRLIVEAPRNKLSAVLSHPALKNFLGQSTSTIDFAKIMNENKCCLINLSRNHLKQEARSLLGALILSRIVLATLSRETIPQEQRVPCTLYCDEVAEYFYPEFFTAIATGARKFQVAMKLFAQSPGQFGEHADILFTNCATITSFNVDRKGAERLVKELFVFTGARVKFQPEHDHARPLYYSIQEEQEGFITQLTTQHPGECIIKIRGAKDNGNPYIASVPLVTPPPIKREQQEEFLQASAAVCYRSQDQINEDRRQRLARWLTPPSSRIVNRS